MPEQVDALADELGPVYGPLAIFAAETGLRTNEWVALERRDVDRAGRAVNRLFPGGSETVATGLEPATSGVTSRFGLRDPGRVRRFLVLRINHNDGSVFSPMPHLRGCEKLAWLRKEVVNVSTEMLTRDGYRVSAMLPPASVSAEKDELRVAVGGSRGKRTRRFLRHYFEMVVVMMLGMGVLGAAFGAFHELAFGSGFASAWRDHVVLAAFAMAFNMTCRWCSGCATGAIAGSGAARWRRR